MRSLRQSGKGTPVLFLTARDAISDRVKGLDSGANDYLVKPFSFEELTARLRAMTRSRFGMVSNVITVLLTFFSFFGTLQYHLFMNGHTMGLRQLIYGF